MQITIDLPDNVTEELLEKPDFKKFVQDNITKILLDYKSQQSSYTAKNKKTDTPITKSLVGIIKNCNLDDEIDYKKHLEDKYL